MNESMLAVMRVVGLVNIELYAAYTRRVACVECDQCTGATVETSPCLTRQNRRCTRNYTHTVYRISALISKYVSKS